VASVDCWFPETGPDNEPAAPAAVISSCDPPVWHGVPAPRSGYIQHLDIEGLTATAVRCNTVIRMERPVGEFVVEGTPLASIMGAATNETVRAVCERYVIATYRTVPQDPGFGVRQMVDIALKALSPGVNDATTAVACIDYLAAVLVRMASRRDPPPARVVDGTIRVIALGANFETALEEAFSEIRRSASTNVRVLVRAVGALELIAGVARSRQRRTALRSQLQRFRETLERSTGLPADREPGLATCARVEGLLGQHPGTDPLSR
jgi:uncharacterized membrane protein